MKISKKICIVSAIIPPRFSGAGLRAYGYASRLYKKDKLAFILTEQSKSIIKNDFSLHRIEKLPLNLIITIPGDTNKDKKRNKNKVKYLLPFILYLMNLLFTLFLKIYKKRKSFEIIHCFGASSWLHLCIIAVGKIFGKKTILEMTLLGSDDPISIQKNPNIVIRNFRIWLFSKAEIVTSISPALTHAYKKSGLPLDRLREIPNSVDINKFYPLTKKEKLNLRKILGFKQDITIILCVGAIIKRKGIDLLIKSFAKYYRKFPNSILVLIGPTDINKENNEFYNKMKELANYLNVEKNIMFTGAKNNIDEYMKVSDLFVFLSRNEGFGTVIIEAMSTGLPVVTLNIPDITEYIIKNKFNGIVVKGENPEKIEITIEEVLKNRNLYENISLNARKTILNRFSDDVIDKKYMQIYNEIG